MAQPPPSATRPTGSLEPAEAPTRDFAVTAADTIDRYVATIRDRTTRPALLASRGLVFGLIIAILGIAALVLVWITWITLLTELFGEVWITFFVTGGIFIVLGAFLMTKRHPPEVGF
jgi:hypothetical protein